MMKKIWLILLLIAFTAIISCENNKSYSDNLGQLPTKYEWVNGTWIGDWIEYDIIDGHITCKDSDGYVFWDEEYVFDKKQKELLVGKRRFVINNKRLLLNDFQHPLIKYETFKLPDKYSGIIGSWFDGYKIITFRDDNTLSLDYADSYIEELKKKDSRWSNIDSYYKIDGKYVVNNEDRLIIVWNKGLERDWIEYVEYPEWVTLLHLDNSNGIQYVPAYTTPSGAHSLEKVPEPVPDGWWAKKTEALRRVFPINKDDFIYGEHALFGMRPVLPKDEQLKERIIKIQGDDRIRLHYQGSMSLYDYVDYLCEIMPDFSERIQKIKVLSNNKDISVYLFNIHNGNEDGYSWLIVDSNNYPIGVVDYPPYAFGAFYKSFDDWVNNSENDVVYWNPWG